MSFSKKFFIISLIAGTCSFSSEPPGGDELPGSRPIVLRFGDPRIRIDPSAPPRAYVGRMRSPAKSPTQEIRQVLENRQPLARLSWKESVMRARHLLQRNRRTAREAGDLQQQAYAFIGLARTITSCHHDERVDTWAEALTFCDQTLRRIQDFKKTEGLKGKALYQLCFEEGRLLRRKAMILKEQGRPHAGALAEAYATFEKTWNTHKTTKACLVYMADLVVTHGFRPVGGTEEDALEHASELLVLYSPHERKGGKAKSLSPLQRKLAEALKKRKSPSPSPEAPLVSPARKDASTEKLASELRKAIRIREAGLSSRSSGKASMSEHPSAPSKEISSKKGKGKKRARSLSLELEDVAGEEDLTKPSVVARSFTVHPGRTFDQLETSAHEFSCGFYSLGFTRDGAVKLLLDHTGDVRVRALVGQQIFDALFAGDHAQLPPSIYDHPEARGYLESYHQTQLNLAKPLSYMRDILGSMGIGGDLDEDRVIYYINTLGLADTQYKQKIASFTRAIDQRNGARGALSAFCQSIETFSNFVIDYVSQP